MNYARSSWIIFFLGVLAVSLLLPRYMHMRPSYIRFVVTVNGRAQIIQHDEKHDAPGAVPHEFCATHSIEPRAMCEEHVQREIERRVFCRSEEEKRRREGSRRW